MPSLYAIANLRLDQADLGPGWEDHPHGLMAVWDSLVEQDAVVLLPGSHCQQPRSPHAGWAYQLLDARAGQIKVLAHGESDPDPVSHVRRSCQALKTLRPLGADAYRVSLTPDQPALVVCSARCSRCPQDAGFDSQRDASGYQHKLATLQRALDQAARLRQPQDALAVVLPESPFANRNQRSEFCERIEQAEAQLCVFGASPFGPSPFEGNSRGTLYRWVEAAYLGMRPLRLGQLTAKGLELGN